MRETNLGALFFKPVVKFSSRNYKYVEDFDGNPRIVQVGIGVDQAIDGVHFRQPADRSPRGPLACHQEEAKGKESSAPYTNQA